MPLACAGRNGVRRVRFVAQPLPVYAPDESHYRQMRAGNDCDRTNAVALSDSIHNGTCLLTSVACDATGMLVPL